MSNQRGQELTLTTASQSELLASVHGSIAAFLEHDLTPTLQMNVLMDNLFALQSHLIKVQKEEAQGRKRARQNDQIIVSPETESAVGLPVALRLELERLRVAEAEGELALERERRRYAAAEAAWEREKKELLGQVEYFGDAEEAARRKLMEGQASWEKVEQSLREEASAAMAREQDLVARLETAAGESLRLKQQIKTASRERTGDATKVSQQLTDELTKKTAEGAEAQKRAREAERRAETAESKLASLEATSVPMVDVTKADLERHQLEKQIRDLQRKLKYKDDEINELEQDQRSCTALAKKVESLEAKNARLIEVSKQADKEIVKYKSLSDVVELWEEQFSRMAASLKQDSLGNVTDNTSDGGHTSVSRGLRLVQRVQEDHAKLVLRCGDVEEALSTCKNEKVKLDRELAAEKRLKLAAERIAEQAKTQCAAAATAVSTLEAEAKYLRDVEAEYTKIFKQDNPNRPTPGTPKTNLAKEKAYMASMSEAEVLRKKLLEAQSALAAVSKSKQDLEQKLDTAEERLAEYERSAAAGDYDRTKTKNV